MHIETLITILSGSRLPLSNEKETQAAIEKILNDNKLYFFREHVLSQLSIPDFFHKPTGILIEVKIKGNAQKIFKQLERYARFDEVKEIILITNRAMGLPKEVMGKPCYVVNIGKAWL